MLTSKRRYGAALKCCYFPLFCFRRQVIYLSLVCINLRLELYNLLLERTNLTKQISNLPGSNITTAVSSPEAHIGKTGNNKNA